MMVSRADAGKKNGEDSGNKKLLNEIEAISKALYLDVKPSKRSNSSSAAGSTPGGKTFLPDSKPTIKDGKGGPPRKDKKSIWSWKSIKAITHIRDRKFNCCFSLQVHSIEGLPQGFNDVSLLVHWKRRDGDLVTKPAKVLLGAAEFEEQLTYTCSIYGSRIGPHHSAKYEAKHFLLYASVFGAPELDLGKHRIDLTRLLPLTLEELQEEQSSGKWTTSFKLSGKAKGATLHVSFGYVVVGDNSIAAGTNQSVQDAVLLKQSSQGIGRSMMKLNQGDGRSSIRHSHSLPSKHDQQSLAPSRSVDDEKELQKVLPLSQSDLATSVDVLYRKLDEEKLDSSVANESRLEAIIAQVEPKISSTCYMPVFGESNCEDEFSVTEQGEEASQNDPVKPEKIDLEDVDISSATGLDAEVDTGIPVAHEEGSNSSRQDEDHESCRKELVIQDSSTNQVDLCSKESLMLELQSALKSVSDLETAALGSSEDYESHVEMESGYGAITSEKTHNSDDDVVANEFLDMLGIQHSPFNLSFESDPESPRERLLRQFEKENLAGGCSLFDFDYGNEVEAEYDFCGATSSELENLDDDFDLSSFILAAEEEHQMEMEARKSKIKAKILEDLETVALMKEWGLNEKAFQHSPPGTSSGFGSPIDFPCEEPVEPPPLGEGVGSFLQTKDGGFLRSMNPSIFKNAKGGGSLIMQVSSPVVVPAEMGSEVMQVLQCLASIGIEKLSMQARKLMPLEDITGKTMQQVAWEAAPTLEGFDSQCLPQLGKIGEDLSSGYTKVQGSSSTSESFGSNSNSLSHGSEYVSLEDLAPLAMEKIEALSVEGLRIQSGMSDEDAPANISAQAIGEFSALQGKGVNISGSLGLEGTAGLQLLDIKDGNDDIDGLMGLSLTLDEWMRLDSGELDDEDHISERTSRILAAHHANSLELFRSGTKGEKRRGKGSGKRYGLLGNNFTVALMVQLRDPLRNYEPVGGPMLALIQVERVFLPPKPKIYNTVSHIKIASVEDEESGSTTGQEMKKEPEEKTSGEDSIQQFRITEVHIAGIKSDEPTKNPRGFANQQKSGSRWLLANGMGKNNKHSLLKAKVASKSSLPETTKAQSGDSLWSISSRAHGAGAKWKDLRALNPHVRNPNVLFPKETIRLR